MHQPGLAKFDSESVFEPGFGRWRVIASGFSCRRNHEIIKR
jgi:hypothetical protein